MTLVQLGTSSFLGYQKVTILEKTNNFVCPDFGTLILVLENVF